MTSAPSKQKPEESTRYLRLSQYRNEDNNRLVYNGINNIKNVFIMIFLEKIKDNDKNVCQYDGSMLS